MNLPPHPHAPLEYWFFKTNAGEVALLVDWIARRRQGTHHLRVSVHTPHYRAVLWETLSTAPVAPNAALHPHHTFGQAGSVAWDLHITDQGAALAPDIFPARLLALPDLVLNSAPRTTFTGTIQVGDQHYTLAAAPGMVSHYWGRRLNPEWWWLSANQFDRPNVAVECAVFRTGLWGLPIHLPLAYCYLHHAQRSTLWFAPPARVRVSGSPAAFTIQFKPFGPTPPLTLQATGHAYGDFGEGICNTLVGDLTLHLGNTLLAHAQGTAGLERRS